MKRSWLLYAAPLVVVLIAYVARRREVHRMFKRVQRATSVVDANLAEIRRLREGLSQRNDEAVAERVRREFDDIDFVALADYLQLKPEPSKPGGESAA